MILYLHFYFLKKNKIIIIIFLKIIIKNYLIENTNYINYQLLFFFNLLNFLKHLKKKMIKSLETIKKISNRVSSIKN